MNDRKMIKIPTEIKLRTEFFEGFGMQELIRTIIVGAITSVIAYLINLLIHQTLFSTFFVIGIIVLTIISLIKGQNNFSMMDSIKNFIRFLLMQSEYKFVGGDFNNKNTRENIKE